MGPINTVIWNLAMKWNSIYAFYTPSTCSLSFSCFSLTIAISSWRPLVTDSLEAMVASLIDELFAMCYNSMENTHVLLGTQLHWQRPDACACMVLSCNVHARKACGWHIATYIHKCSNFSRMYDLCGACFSSPQLWKFYIPSSWIAVENNIVNGRQYYSVCIDYFRC